MSRLPRARLSPQLLLTTFSRASHSPPPVSPFLHFPQSLTSVANSLSVTGKPSVVTAALTADKGLFVDTPAQHYGVAAALPTPFNPADGLVLQYEATMQDGRALTVYS